MTYNELRTNYIEYELRSNLYSKDSPSIEYVLDRYLDQLSIDFLREVNEKIKIVFFLTKKFNNYNLFLQEEEKLGWEDFLRIRYKRLKEFWK